MAMAVLMMMGVVFWTWILGLTDHESETMDGGRRLKMKAGERKKKKKGVGPARQNALRCCGTIFPFPLDFLAVDGSLRRAMARYIMSHASGEKAGGRPDLGIRLVVRLSPSGDVCEGMF